jgi:hypothetical protein
MGPLGKILLCFFFALISLLVRLGMRVPNWEGGNYLGEDFFATFRCFFAKMAACPSHAGKKR